MARSIPEQQLADRLSRSDELMAMMIPILRDIRDKRIGDLPRTPDVVTDGMAELVDLMKQQHEIDYEPFTLTYPYNGTRLTIAAGTTVFDFRAGTIKAPGAATVDMTTTLATRRKDFMRALTFNADQEVILQIESEDKIICRAGNWPIFPFKEFTKVRFTVTESTEILISASTSSAAIIHMQGEMSPNIAAFTGDVYENEHTMTALDAWEVPTAVYLQNFSVATEENTPTGIFFKSDGLKMYVLGDAGNDVNEYDLSAAWDVSSAVYLQNFSVATEETLPSGIFFKSDGLKMYVLGDFGNDVNEYDLGTAWDVSSAVYLQNFSVATEETSPVDIFFSPTGLKMYVLGDHGDDVNEYDLSPAWDVSTAAYLQNISVATQDTTPTGIFFKSDGLKMYILGTAGNDVNEYDLSTAWDVSSAVYLQNISVATKSVSSTGLFFTPDGTKMYIIDSLADRVFEYDVAPYRFETSDLLLRDVIIRISTYDAEIGDSTRQRYPKSAGSAFGFTQVNLAELYVKNANPSNNTKINILGVRL